MFSQILWRVHGGQSFSIPLAAVTVTTSFPAMSPEIWWIAGASWADRHTCCGFSTLPFPPAHHLHCGLGRFSQTQCIWGGYSPSQGNSWGLFRCIASGIRTFKAMRKKSRYLNEDSLTNVSHVSLCRVHVLLPIGVESRACGWCGCKWLLPGVFLFATCDPVWHNGKMTLHCVWETGTTLGLVVSCCCTTPLTCAAT